MAVDKVINDHIDEQDKLEEAAAKDIDAILAKMSIDDLIENPNEALEEVAFLIKDLILSKYMEDAVENGLEVAAKFKSLKRDIKIPDSDDPNLNVGTEVERGVDD